MQKEKIGFVIAGLILIGIGAITGIDMALHWSDWHAMTLPWGTGNYFFIFGFLIAGVIVLARGNRPAAARLKATREGTSDTRVIEKEKTIIKEIVKIKCQHCGMLVENTVSVCPSCGANM